MGQIALSAKLDSLWKRRHSLLLLTILLSLLVHLLAGLGLSWLPPVVTKSKKQIQAPVKLQFTEKSSPKETESTRIEKKTKDEEKSHTIVEVPLPETEAPDKPAYLGAQNHKTAQETKTQPKASTPGADATPIQNGPLRLKVETAPGGKIKVPAGKNLKEFMPNQLDVINTGHNDYLHDKKLPVGPIMDVNTTDFRFIGFFTAVRKAVDLAYYDIGPTLKDKSYIRDKVENVGKARLQGVSVVQLKVARSGLLVETKLVQTSGDKDVDEFWTRILNLAAPYPPLPRDYPDEELLFTYKLYYDLVFEGDQRKRRFMF